MAESLINKLMTELLDEITKSNPEKSKEHPDISLMAASMKIDSIFEEVKENSTLRDEHKQQLSDVIQNLQNLISD